jgi:hemolysin activation/secretion protein
MGISLGYQWIRQRQENLSLKLTLDGRDSTSELEGADLSRDHIRTVRMSASYDTADRWRGYDSATFTLTQGIDGLGASEKGDRDLSRAGALPDFTKAEATLSRLQALTENWALQLATSGQLASGTLYSSEQFGYGGQAFGRAFDESEIVGDSGIAASLELQYGGWKDITPQVTWQPYAFIDTGQVWNDGVGQPPHETGSSTGLGIRFATEWNQSGSLGLAFPIDRNIAAPLYGTSDNGPRILLRVSQEF